MRKGYWLYDINWLTNGFCYRTSLNLTKEDLDNARKTARLLGEKIEVIDKRYVRYE